ncbi:hypothetical protein H4R33_002942 [Dimargaris cristalligena]|uniref:Protein YAE1 n=1 Tax=Dimargaris cristalligena TaxID=215637 RepID=A0A4P9ZYF6_9FUNG|nr:hypothetical protein H4R33_002942 [Dimargaris cristalligena]RKP38754.1 hypothetical protein BJ085DRAFT_30166 [Dimargaris cristalligena]|eukprot:RKP38754.1 hypothetical protein BJ085DRAFT_30166 [Dimargaris cristalligena]
MSDSDDLWGSASDSDNVDYDRAMADREWRRLQDIHGNAGYKDGISSSREENIQPGFDLGFAEGLRAGLALGLLEGRLSAHRDRLVKQTPSKPDVGQTDTAATIDQSEPLEFLRQSLAALTFDGLFPNQHFLAPSTTTSDSLANQSQQSSPPVVAQLWLSSTSDSELNASVGIGGETDASSRSSTHPRTNDSPAVPVWSNLTFIDADQRSRLTPFRNAICKLNGQENGPSPAE